MTVHLVHGNWREWECKNPFLVVSNLRCSPCVPDHFHNFSTLFVFYFFPNFTKIHLGGENITSASFWRRKWSSYWYINFNNFKLALNFVCVLSHGPV